MSNDDGSVLSDRLGMIAVVFLYTVLIILDRGWIGWTPWGAGAAALPDPSVVMLAVAVGAVAGALTVVLNLRFGRFLVMIVAVGVPFILLLYVVVHFVFEIEEANAVLDLASLAYLWTTFSGLLVLAFVYGWSSDT